MRETARPITLTIAALGGQGGGVVQDDPATLSRTDAEDSHRLRLLARPLSGFLRSASSTQLA